MEAYIRGLIPNLAQLRDMPAKFIQMYCHIVAHKFFFFCDLSRRGKACIKKILLSNCLQELMELHQGRNVVIEQSYGAPKVTKDGVTVAKSIEFKDRVKNVGASLVKQVANATNDGTTCAMVLTHAIYSEGCKSVAAGMNAMDLRCGINMVVDSVVTYLKSKARMISTSEEIAQVYKI